MATIPNPTRIQRALPDGRMNVVNMDVSNVGAGAAYVGEALTKIDQVNRDHKYNTATLNMGIELEKQRRAYDQDPDHGTFVERFDAGVNGKLNEFAAGLDVRDRERFMGTQKLAAERARTNVMGLAFKKDRDENRAIMDTQLIESRNAGMSGDMGAMSKGTKALLDTGVAKGYYSAEEAAEKYAKWQLDTATGKLDTLHGEELLDAIGQISKHLPPDVEAQYRRAAETEVIGGRAQATVDGMDMKVEVDVGMDQIENMKLKPKERAETERRYREQHAIQKQAVLEKQAQIVKTASLGMQRVPVDTISPEDWAFLNDTQRQNLIILNNPPRAVSDPEMVRYLERQLAQGHWGKVTSVLSNSKGLLKPSDQVKYAKAAADGIAPEGSSDSEYIKAMLPGKNQAQLRDAMVPMVDGWRDRFKATYQKSPTPEQTQAEIRRLIMDYDRGDGSWYDVFISDVPIHQLEHDEQKKALDKVHREEIRNRNPEIYDNIMEALEKDGRPLDRWEMEDAMDRIINQRSIRNKPVDLPGDL